MTDQASRGRSPKRPAADPLEPSLGDVKFDEWFQSPVFDADPDERLEELATARRGPIRLAANTLLRVNARAEQVRARPDRSGRRASQPGGGATDGPGGATDGAEDPAGAEAPDAPAAKPEVGKAAAAGKKPAAAAKKTAAAGKKTAAAGKKAGSGKKTVAARKVRAAAAAPALEAAPPLEPTSASGQMEEPRSVRSRWTRTLDRWADKEAAAQHRLERMMTPRRRRS